MGLCWPALAGRCTPWRDMRRMRATSSNECDTIMPPSPVVIFLLAKKLKTTASPAAANQWASHYIPHRSRAPHLQSPSSRGAPRTARSLPCSRAIGNVNGQNRASAARQTPMERVSIDVQIFADVAKHRAGSGLFNRLYRSAVSQRSGNDFITGPMFNADKARLSPAVQELTASAAPAPT